VAITHVVDDSRQSKTAGTTIAGTGLGAASIALNDLIVVCFTSDDVAGTYSCADDQGNTYQTDVARFANAAHVSLVVFSAIVATDANTIVTVSHPSLTARALEIFVFRGTDTSASRVDGTPVTATGTGNASSGNLTTSSADSVMVGISGYESDSSNTYTGDGAFVNGKVGTTGGGDATNITQESGYNILTGTATDAYDTTNSASRSWAAALLAYKVPAGAAGSLVIPNRVGRLTYLRR